MHDTKSSAECHISPDVAQLVLLGDALLQAALLQIAAPCAYMKHGIGVAVAGHEHVADARLETYPTRVDCSAKGNLRLATCGSLQEAVADAT